MLMQAWQGGRLLAVHNQMLWLKILLWVHDHNILVSTEKTNLHISESDQAAIVEVLKNKLIEDKKIMSNWDTSMIHMERGIAFKL